ncbi:hypothetical protein SDC9_160757 [bioreactor metagenome]|uniref:Uncharacterized protein n=1 Tax=bioreactor metagenome TaxID=1076179 RepID=A0A645FIH1_9ZZZZ
MAEEIVKDVGLDDVFELFGLAYPVRDREFALGQQREERYLGNQTRNADDLPSRGLEQSLVDFLEARNAFLCAQRRQGVDEMLAGAARQQRGLALVEAVVGVMLGLGIGGIVLCAGVVGMGTRVVAAWRAIGLAIDDGGRADAAGHGGVVLDAVHRALPEMRGREGCSQSSWPGRSREKEMRAGRWLSASVSGRA